MLNFEVLQCYFILTHLPQILRENTTLPHPQLSTVEWGQAELFSLLLKKNLQ